MTVSGVFDRSFIRKVVLGIIIVLIFLDFPWLCQTHEHSHEDEHDSPSFKYSRQANTQYSSEHKPKVKVNIASTREDTLTLWARAIGSTLLISAAPFFVLYLVPLDNSKEREPLLKILLSFASGSLLGDAFLHLIPHALHPHSADEEHSHSHSHLHSAGHSHGPHDMRVGFWVLLGIIVFLVVEKLVRLVKGGHGHSHSAAVPVETNSSADKPDEDRKTDNDKGQEKKEHALSETAHHDHGNGYILSVLKPDI
ncbi:hypothetical protein PR048_004052 [Dryococelus australis]|uniref:Solute carrier family 39 member 7 n=1 Tax=Dryococelus australis TaxID=614101 RepID=A0ABQ9I4G5_9NEOP|nr:hypothetical protein PR048_004052 [Dryococelus australis]